MTIEIDDSGTGDLLGPAFILFWRRETNDLIIKEVPLDLYQSSDFNMLTKNYIRDLFLEAFRGVRVFPRVWPFSIAQEFQPCVFPTQ